MGEQSVQTQTPPTPPDGQGLTFEGWTRLSFDRYTQLVRDTLQVPAAIVSILGEQSQSLLGASGLPEPWQTQRWTPLIDSICRLVARGGVPLAVRDVRVDHRTNHTAAAADLEVVAYLGVPLREAGQIVGALCAIDRDPREWTDRETHILTGLAAACSAELTLRDSHDQAHMGRRETESARDRAEEHGRDAQIAQHRSEEQTVAFRASEQHSRLLLTLSEALAATSSVQNVIQVVQQAAATHLNTQAATFTLDEHPSRQALGTHSSPLGEGDQRPLADRSVWAPLSGTLSGRLTLIWSTPEQARPWVNAALQADDNRQAGPGGAAASQQSRAEEIVLALAHYASMALDRAILLQERCGVATTLQHAMLTTLPRRPDTELAARYVPAASANQVGGDWYDAVVIPAPSPDRSQDLALIIGDVAGHDIQAAATMGQVRSILRGLLIDRCEPPAQMVTRLDDALAGLDMPTCSTLVLAILHPENEMGLRQLSWANAGHPAPLLVDATGQARFLNEPSDLLLGIPYDLPRHTHKTQLAPGDTLLLYTDGLIERVAHTLPQGQEALQRSASRHHHLPVQDMLDRILQDLITHAPDDDCAVLVMRLPHEPTPSGLPLK